jgi:hypothetical protein
MADDGYGGRVRTVVLRLQRAADLRSHAERPEIIAIDDFRDARLCLAVGQDGRAEPAPPCHALEDRLSRAQILIIVPGEIDDRPAAGWEVIDLDDPFDAGHARWRTCYHMNE